MTESLSTEVSVTTDLSFPGPLHEDGKDSSSVVLDWGSSDADSYDIYYRESSTSSWTKDGNVTSTSYTVSSLSSDTTYDFYVTAKTEHKSADSSVITVSTDKAPPSAPSNLSLSSPDATSVELTWSDNSDNESGFKIYRGTSSGSLSQIADISADSTSYTDSSPTLGKANYYRVNVYNSAGSASSSEQSIQVAFVAKIYDGSSWNEKVVKYGSGNIPSNVQYWDGSSWVQI